MTMASKQKYLVVKQKCLVGVNDKIMGVARPSLIAFVDPLRLPEAFFLCPDNIKALSPTQTPLNNKA